MGGRILPRIGMFGNGTAVALYPCGATEKSVGDMFDGKTALKPRISFIDGTDR